MDSKKTRSLQNSAMHLRKACNHPYLFLAGQAPPYEPADREELVRASGKLALLDNILPKLCATGKHSACNQERFTGARAGVTA
jgi:SNF2 family DNA or RNA helicase